MRVEETALLVDRYNDFLSEGGKVRVVGVIANTYIESTSRPAVELGYHLTPVRDASAAQTREMMRATYELNGATFAHAMVTKNELVAAIGPSSAPSAGALAIH